MKPNIGQIDRLIRYVLSGVFAVLAAVFFQGALQIVFVILAITMAVTATINFCPLYMIMRLSTLRSATDNK